MTLIPSEAWNVRGVEGDHYKVGPFCDAPGCKLPVDHKHHLWRRSFLGGDYWWVRVPTMEGATRTIRNVVGLCYHHHDDVTGDVGGHKAWIKWVPERGDFDWLESVDYGHWVKIGTLTLPAPSESAAPARPMMPDSNRCPTCGRVKHAEHEHHEPGPRRARKSWTVKVPDDAEDGAAILDELVEIVAEAIGAEEHTSALKRYHVLVPALVWIVQNQDDFSRDFYDERKAV
jgi:hypothetical protein